VHLKSLELLGFKSFSDKTRLEFAEGITALLGPNGCGKSNIVDAIKWALGEQSAKALRADKMEDVLFSGSETRKALNVADVTLGMGNDSGQLPLDAAEISIRRRLYRSGDSEYFINNLPVRLRDVRELFFDTGVGKSAYSMMEQGKIDQILSNKPEERRSVFEEAAGITKYRVKGQEAERKLLKTQENMRQVEGILAEVKRSYENLKQQAAKTQSYRDLREKIFEIELNTHLLRLRDLTQQREELEERLSRQSEQREQLKQEIDALRHSMEQSIDQVNSMESRLIEEQKKLYQTDLDKRSKDSQARMLGERIAEIEGKIASEQERARNLERKLNQGKEEQARRRQEMEELHSLLADVEGNILGFERDITQFEETVRNNEQEALRQRQEAEQLDKELDRLRGDLRGLTDDIVTQLDQRLKELGYSGQERQQTEGRIQAVLDQLRIQFQGKARLIEDSLALRDLPAGERSRLLQTLRQLVEEALKRIEELRGYFADYKRYTPAFLEEFLAPEGIITRKRELDQRITETHARITARRNRSEELRVENQGLSRRIAEYHRTLEELRVNRAQLFTRRSSLEKENERLQENLSEQELTLSESRREIESSSRRLEETRTQIAALTAEKQRLESENLAIRAELSTLEKQINRNNQNLVHTEKKLKQKSEGLDRSRDDLEKLQMRLVELRAEIRGLHTTFSELYGRELSDYESQMYQVQGPLRELRSALAGHREELKKLGQVNLMAPEEFAEVSERYRFLTDQLADLRKAYEDLQKITREIRSESSEIFLETYNTIKKNFHLMFRRLFGGGRAELKLLDPEHVLESGIEIYAQPPGKKLENVNLLSGGERSLTAIALLFAFYMVRPSPFCILDEIDAALDDQNVSRFVHVLKEFAGSSQFLVVTHNKKTIASADTLLGVTMEESGVSKIITIRLENRVEEKSYA
jgi:chromosome segregation protein